MARQAEVQLRELEREVAANRSLYQTLLVRLKETEQQQEIVQADARLISPAQPPDAPSSPSPKLFAMVGFTASLVLGSMLALLLEQLDNTLRSGRQVEELFGLPSLGLVPQVADPRPDARLHRHMIDHLQSAYAEAVHALYTQVCLTAPGQPPRAAILITSALPGEGKTSLAASLAVFAVRSAARHCWWTLTSAAPPSHGRSGPGRPRMHWRCSPAPSPSRTRWCAIPQRGAPVAAGEGHENPITLLTSERLLAVLRKAREFYDHVIIDTPPVLGLPDVMALCAAADATLFVVRWDHLGGTP